MKILSLFAITFLLSSCYVGRMLVYNVSDVNDYKKSPQLCIAHPEKSFHFQQAKQPLILDSALYPSALINEETMTNFERLFAETKTTSFLIIRNDTILFEQYFEGTDESSLMTSFSVNKSFISALVGIAIAEGKIGSEQDSITKYLEFDNPGFGKITIKHLLDMRSGIKFNENYFNPLAPIGKYYYGNHLKRFVKKLKVNQDPGTYEYISVNTLLLGMIIEKATGITLDQYYQEKLWQPLGMEFDATLNIDSKKGNQVKAYCGLNACSRDYAKFGRLYLMGGNWNGQQIVPVEWVKASIKPAYETRSSVYYQNQWRTDNQGNFFAQGLLGQFIFVNPKTKVIIVRTGKKSGIPNWPSVMEYLSSRL